MPTLRQGPPHSQRDAQGPGGGALAQLARRLGYHGEDPGARLLAEYARVTEGVRAAFLEVVGAPPSA